MSVYINMEMPTSCSVCPMLEGDRLDGLCHAASRWLDDEEYWTWYIYPEGDTDDSKPCNCPLFPVPEHGRLIDADVLFDFILNIYKTAQGDARKAYSDVLDTIVATGDVIPADKEVDNG